MKWTSLSKHTWNGAFSANFIFEIDIPVSYFINLLVLFISLKSIIITYLQNSANPLPSMCSLYLFSDSFIVWLCFQLNPFHRPKTRCHKVKDLRRSALHQGPSRRKQNTAKKSFLAVPDILKEDFIGVIKPSEFVAAFDTNFWRCL